MSLFMLTRWCTYGLLGLYDRCTMKKRPDEAPHAISRILMTELTRIGDVLVTTPVLKAVRDKYTGAEITCVVRNSCKDILQQNPYVDLVIGIWDGTNPGPFLHALAAIRRLKPDLVVSLSPSLKNSVVAHFCGARYKVGYLNDRSGLPRFFKDHPIEARGFAYIKQVCYQKDEHLTIRAAKAVLPLDVECSARNLEFFLDPGTRAKAEEVLKEGHLRIVVHPTSGWRYKSWPEDRFIGLFVMIRSRFRHRPLQLILIGDHRDSKTLARMNKSLDAELTVIQGYPLPVVAAIIRNSDLFIGNDSGPLHMAEAFGIPFVGLFGPSLPKTAGPLSDGVFVSKRVACAPCTQTRCPRAKQEASTCMELIDVETVFRAVVERLGDHP